MQVEDDWVSRCQGEVVVIGEKVPVEDRRGAGRGQQRCR